MNESCTIQTANILVNALFESFFSHCFHPFPFFFVDFILFTHRFFSLQQNFVLLHMHTLVMCSINIICRYTIELFFPRTEWIKENEPREHYCCFMDARAIGMVTLKKKQRIPFSIAVDFKCDWMQRNIENGKEYYYRFCRGNSKDRLFILSAYDSITKKTQHLLFMCPWPLDCALKQSSERINNDVQCAHIKCGVKMHSKKCKINNHSKYVINNKLMRT